MNARNTLIALFTATTLTTGIALRPTQAQTVQQGQFPVQPLNSFTMPASAIGVWQGGIHSKGDDAVTSLRLQIKSSALGYQGTWQVLGENGVLQQGKLSGTQTGGKVTLKLEKFSGNTSLMLNGTIKGALMSGQVANSNFVFSLNKN
ncbi:hypothetical protein NC981_02120 [Leptolyngbya sp. DQ-M1]|uniref:hypothetical protein n=1 Tax=Leptolyngbya sp. DQ-M1 TaxID=2933920 RepID=UPI0032971055